MKILFDHFMDGIHIAAASFYDLHPLAEKEFSAKEVVRLFHEFETLVSDEDPFWEKQKKIEFIMDDGSLRELDLQKESYHIIDGYSTDNVWSFFNATEHAYFRPVSTQTFFESSSKGYLSYSGPGIVLKYLSVASKLFKHYGEENYFKNIHPHRDSLKNAIVQIFDLEMFPEETILRNKILKEKNSLDYAIKQKDYPSFVKYACELLELCPELKTNPTCKKLEHIQKMYNILVSRIKTLINPFIEVIADIKVE